MQGMCKVDLFRPWAPSQAILDVLGGSAISRYQIEVAALRSLLDRILRLHDSVPST